MDTVGGHFIDTIYFPSGKAWKYNRAKRMNKRGSLFLKARRFLI